VLKRWLGGKGISQTGIKGLGHMEREVRDIKYRDDETCNNWAVSMGEKEEFLSP
jgi:hypothetical protein